MSSWLLGSSRHQNEYNLLTAFILYDPVLQNLTESHARNLCFKIAIAPGLHGCIVLTNCCVVGLLTVRMDSCHFTDNSHSVTSCHPKSVWRHDMVREQYYAALYLCPSLIKALSDWTVSCRFLLKCTLCCCSVSLKYLPEFCLPLDPEVKWFVNNLKTLCIRVSNRMQEVLIKAPTINYIFGCYYTLMWLFTKHT